ncbi:MAG: hypothetical protein BWY21_02036 [Parcubacteria group bacterium ADurb.Bin216]|nr:MAG: hypothetical protein BWY21_02036 [Parcubacteria group bacterium ADurb.Bin216]
MAPAIIAPIGLRANPNKDLRPKNPANPNAEGTPLTRVNVFTPPVNTLENIFPNPAIEEAVSERSKTSTINPIINPPKSIISPAIAKLNVATTKAIITFGKTLPNVTIA